MLLIRCTECGFPVGALDAPTADSIRAALATNNNANAVETAKVRAMVSLLPANIAETLGKFLTFVCPTCIRSNHSGTQIHEAITVEQGDAFFGPYDTRKDGAEVGAKDGEGQPAVGRGDGEPVDGDAR